ncbi:MAG: TM1802 family CRISPR-associated protein, partial [Pseudomonadota bacterium]
EGKKKTGEPYRTAAGWIRHIVWWLYYFKRLEVMKMEDKFYEPQMERLKPYFGLESGIDSPQKAYAFLLGALYGKVLQVQGAKGVNVGANALTWLKRLTLKGRDLPELYVKIREKLLAYETEKSEDVRELIAEIGNLGWRLGDNIELGEISTNYYLLLGQSLTTTILPKKEGK